MIFLPVRKKESPLINDAWAFFLPWCQCLQRAVDATQTVDVPFFQVIAIDKPHLIEFCQGVINLMRLAMNVENLPGFHILQVVCLQLSGNVVNDTFILLIQRSEFSGLAWGMALRDDGDLKPVDVV